MNQQDLIEENFENLLYRQRNCGDIHCKECPFYIKSRSKKQITCGQVKISILLKRMKGIPNGNK